MKRRLAFWILVIMALLAALPAVLCGLVWWSSTHPLPDGGGVTIFMIDGVHHAPDGTTKEVTVTTRQAGVAAVVFLAVALLSASAAFALVRTGKKE